jgi:nitrite reductase/ring-hydroxylating ferredoxin subunit
MRERSRSENLMPFETYLNLIQQLDDMVVGFENHPDLRTREQVVTLLEGVDALHREGLRRLVAALRAAGAGAQVDRATADPVVKTLLGLYDLADLGLPDERPPTLTPGTSFIPLESIPTSRKPRADWVEISQLADLPPGATRAAEVDEIRVLLANVGGDVFAYRNACAGTELPLDSGQLIGVELICPWHGCRYDARTGLRRDGGEGRLDVYPVAVRGMSIQLARQQPSGDPTAVRDR